MKSKTTAVLLAFFLGGLGLHKFYLGKTFQGFLYLIFCWTYIPAIISFIEGIIYLCINDNDFQTKYGSMHKVKKYINAPNQTMVKSKFEIKK